MALQEPLEKAPSVKGRALVHQAVECSAAVTLLR